MLRKILAACLVRLHLVERPDFFVVTSIDMPAPNELKPGKAIVVGPRQTPKWMTFQCPSGCGTPLLLSLNPKRRPRWAVASDWLARPTLTPSIRRTDGCRCHFWIRKGRVEWCKDSGKILPEN
ncbi:hypothetical protein LB553_28640 [Mesorhizobium sp. CA8]|uniref:DUF6527 family protein n=1 Tax=unclassified Mesorhizobium TaxID=325217 RepID=UPI001CCDBAB0|nr:MULTISPECIES: DUF6527 family protein [unclassified Mesorhizobium]MBZ9764806.1 hypothetical protein [Mesorhizobium sp. CA8]MBZ9822758.1 hypothetical protein [Mesorhizobium sp. CA4]